MMEGNAWNLDRLLLDMRRIKQIQHENQLIAITETDVTWKELRA